MSVSAMDMINSAIGPVPWYVSTFPILQDGQGKRYVWAEWQDPKPYRSLVYLAKEDEAGQARLALAMYVRPFPISDNCVGVAYSDEDALTITAFEPEKLPAFLLNSVPRDVCLRNDKTHWYSLAGPLSQMTLSPYLAEGRYEIEVPEAFSEADDLLIPLPVTGRVDDNDPACVIYDISLSQGSVRVLPQIWFTRGIFDIGYQWITRLARDPASGRIVGDGIRVGPFELTDDGCNLSRWLKGK